jgi:hypothetical protein
MKNAITALALTASLAGCGAATSGGGQHGGPPNQVVGNSSDKQRQADATFHARITAFERLYEARWHVGVVTAACVATSLVKGIATKDSLAYPNLLPESRVLAMSPHSVLGGACG